MVVALAEGYGVRALDRAMLVLEAFPPDGEASLADLAAGTGLPKSTVHRLLGTLVAAGYVEADGRPGRYRLGLRLLLLGQRAVASSSLLAAVRPAMRRVLAATGETVFCGTLVGSSVVFLDVVTSSRPVAPLPAPGSRAPVHTSSMGKVILAHRAPEDQVRTLAGHHLRPYTAHTITDRARLGEVLRDARRRGFAVSAEEEDPGISCVAVPVRDRRGDVVAALSVAAPAERLTPAVQERFVGVLLEASARASRSLGWVPPPARAAGH
jgi:IclR family acetate operon transcriptional repressor